MATKRNIGEGEEQGAKKARTELGIYRDAEGEERQEVRVLIDNFEAAVIIGKGGENVKQIRGDSHTFVSIIKNKDDSKKERVMQIRGTPENNANALRMIADLMIRTSNEKEGATDVDNWPFKLLIHKSSAGSIIGRGGEIIRAMQAETGARISLSTEPLGMSTEKTVTVTGVPDIQQTAIGRILTQISENPLKPGTSSMLYEPGAMNAAAAFGGYGAPPQGYMPQYGMPPQGMMGGMGMGGRGMGMGGPPPWGNKSQKIVIPSVTGGAVIGKGGSIIAEIKAQSQTNISVAPAEAGGAERVVTITGSEQGIQTAISLIRQRVESFVQPPM